MLVKAVLVQTLYSEIEELGKQNIQKELVSSDLQASSKYLQIILDACILKLRILTKKDASDDTILDLCEALLHFILTASILPSATKIEVDKELKIDLVIPNLHSLMKDPHKSLIIDIVRDSAYAKRISKIKSLQPNIENIWLISVRPLGIAEARNYCVFHEGVSKRFCDIIIDIQRFLRDSGDTTMRFVHS
jgi:hypothetical protein